LSSITRALELRGLNLSLLPLIEQRLQVPQLSFSLSDWIPSYALSLSRHDDPKAVADLFETLARHALSEDEATRAKIFAHFNADFRNPWTFDSSEAAVPSYIDLMNRLSHDPLYFFPVLEELYRYELHLARTFQMPTI